MTDLVQRPSVLSLEGIGVVAQTASAAFMLAIGLTMRPEQFSLGGLGLDDSL